MRWFLWLLLWVACAPAPVPVSVTPTPTPRQGPPAPPFRLEPPAAPAPSSLSGEESASRAMRLYEQARYDEAAVEYARAVAAGVDARYNLACTLALTGKNEEALYYLLAAADREGVDAAWAGADPDLAVLREDPRWPRVRAYLEECQRYWATQDILETSLVVPTGYQPGKPIPVLIGLHGLGGDHRFVHESMQPLADELGVAFLGVSGTEPLGPRTFAWSEDVQRDAAHVERGLKAVSDRLTPGPRALYGFSQGAKTAFEVAAAYPERFRGAIVFSPGGRQDMSTIGFQPGNKRQRFVLRAGAQEHPGNVALVREEAAWARKAGAECRMTLYEGMSEHTFPPDFVDEFGGWIRFVIGPDGWARGGAGGTSSAGR